MAFEFESDNEEQKILILDFGGQYKELIARRIRECGVYSVIMPYDTDIEEIKRMAPAGIVFTGGPNSVNDPSSPFCERQIFDLGIPILGICYGMQVIAHMLGGSVTPCKKSEYGRTACIVDPSSKLFSSLDAEQTVLMSHTDMVSRLPDGFVSIASTSLCPTAAFSCDSRGIYGVQFHPEVENTENGTAMLGNFLFRICKARGDYSMDDYLKRQIRDVKQRVGENKRVLLGLSGGVDSSVCASLLSEAIHERLVCIYIDHGMMRKSETENIRSVFEKKNLNFVYVDAKKCFLESLSGVVDPEEKRKIIGREFVRVFEEEAKKHKNPEFLAQGTIYPDIVESGKNKSAVIKSHHNVGGLPDNLGFEGVIEPLRGLFKDEVRKLGIMLGLPASLVYRQPFPGPGLAVRIIGEITEEKIEILQNADAIFREEVDRLRKKPDQYFAVLTDVRSVGVMGDFRTYDYTVALRAVRTNDFMTCEYVPLSHKLLSRVCARITNEVNGVNRVVYDITGKPPATIEWL